jgi:hypothetical protein
MQRTPLFFGTKTVTAFAVAFASYGFAQENAAPTPPPKAFHILDQREVWVGGRTITYNRVAPPVFASSSPSPTPSPTPPVGKRIRSMQQQAAKKTVMLSVSATVYDRQITLVRWSDKSGTHRAFSNVDFNYFSGTPVVETADTSYFLIMGLGNETHGQAATDNIPLPVLAYFSGTGAQYAVIQDGSTPPTEESLKQIDDLHAYFNANKQWMIDEYNKRQQADAKRQQWLKDHPPVPKDTVINFWPKKSSVYLSGQNQGGAK